MENPMATITIPDSTFDRLTRQAAAIGITVEQLVLPVLDQIAPPGPTPEERRRAFEEWRKRVEERAGMYPPGFQVDDSREAIYKEREDAQLAPPRPVGTVGPEPSPPEPPLPLTGAAWRAELEAWRRDAEALSGRYPPGFVLDDSRETIYREREDAQM
jgi:hypothetical protein